jgi:predicted amidohydrolase
MTIRVALGEYDTGWHDPETSLARAADVIAKAREGGADLVVLPEMCTTGFTMEAEKWAEQLDGPSIAELARLARESSIHVIAGVATRGEGETYYNSALLIGPQGELLTEYRKQRLFDFAREHETYAAGDRPVIVQVGDVKLALFICFDLRFPELFRAAAPYADAIVVIANWPRKRQMHWEVLLRARAIENQAYVIAVNRTGSGGELRYDGGSVVHEPWGDTIASGPLAIATIDAGMVTSLRSKFPVTEDRRGRTRMEN